MVSNGGVARSGKDSIDHGPGSHDDLANAVAGAADLASGRRDHPPAQFGTYGYYVRENKPHPWDGPLEGGGYATTRLRLRPRRPHRNACNFKPPYDTWPFPRAAFETAIGFSPRQLLKTCEDHRLYCLAEGRVTELQSFAQQPPSIIVTPTATGLDGIFDREMKDANVAGLLDQEQEERLRALLGDALALLAKHLDLPDDIDVEFRGDPDQRRPSLHGRLAFIFHSDGDREQQFCFRILVHSNAIAFQSRLNAAMVASGVDRALSFRHLFILRPDEPPSGPKTRQLIQKFLQAGGRFIAPTEGDLRAFVALQNMVKRNLAGFDVWLRQRKPLFSTTLFKSADLCPPGFLPPPQPDRGQSAPLGAPLGSREQPQTQPLNKVSDARGVAHTTHVTAKNGGSREIPIGRRYERGNLGSPETLPADLLTRHVAIIAGSGSGKTCCCEGLLRRRLSSEYRPSCLTPIMTSRVLATSGRIDHGASRIGNAPRLAAGIADQLRAAIATNPLIQSRGPILDARLLFEGGSRTRISIISFVGLASDEARQSFVNQLNMSLFTWIKRNPSATGRLYVLDEAQNFAASQKTTPCKESTTSLAAQARKYGLGMIFATQLPKGIDNKIVSNCTTHFYGRMSSPAAIDATRELMAAKGGGGDDIARLNRGEFYFSTEGLSRPIKIHAPLCLTWHPQNPLTEEEVLAKTRS